MEVSRRRFVGEALAASVIGATGKSAMAEPTDVIARWQTDTELVSSDVYRQYLRDGDTRGLVTLEKLEAAAEKLLREVNDTAVV